MHGRRRGGVRRVASGPCRTIERIERSVLPGNALLLPTTAPLRSYNTATGPLGRACELNAMPACAKQLLCVAQPLRRCGRAGLRPHASSSQQPAGEKFADASVVNWVFSTPTGLSSFVPPLAAASVAEAKLKRARKVQEATPSAQRLLSAADALGLVLAAATGLACPPGLEPVRSRPPSSRTVSFWRSRHSQIQAQEEPPASRSTRRTRTLTFTCNVCGERSSR